MRSMFGTKTNTVNPEINDASIIIEFEHFDKEISSAYIRAKNGNYVAIIILQQIKEKLMEYDLYYLLNVERVFKKQKIDIYRKLTMLNFNEPNNGNEFTIYSDLEYPFLVDAVQNVLIEKNKQEKLKKKLRNTMFFIPKFRKIKPSLDLSGGKSRSNRNRNHKKRCQTRRKSARKYKK